MESKNLLVALTKTNKETHIKLEKLKMNIKHTPNLKLKLKDITNKINHAYRLLILCASALVWRA